MQKRLERRAMSILLHTVVKLMEQAWFLLGCLLDEDEASVVVREGPLMRCLSEKEVRLMDQRRKKLWELAQDLKTIANHLRKTSRS